MGESSFSLISVKYKIKSIENVLLGITELFSLKHFMFAHHFCILYCHGTWLCIVTVHGILLWRYTTLYFMVHGIVLSRYKILYYHVILDFTVTVHDVVLSQYTILYCHSTRNCTVAVHDIILSQYSIYCTFVVHCIVLLRKLYKVQICPMYCTIAVHIYLIAGLRMVGVKGRCTTHGRRKNIPEINHFNIYCSRLMIALQTVNWSTERGGMVGIMLLESFDNLLGRLFNLLL